DDLDEHRVPLVVDVVREATPTVSSAHEVHAEAGTGQLVDHLLAVGGVASLDREEDLDLVHGQPDACPVVLDGEDVEAHLGHQAGEGGQGPGPVVEHDAQDEVAPGRGQAVVDELDQ